MRMMESFNTFVDTMLEEQDKFETMQNDVSSKKENVESVLNELDSREKEIIDAIQQSIAEMNDESVQEIFSNTSKSLGATMSAVNNKLQEAVRGMQFINDFEKHFTVSVFGKVKAGKSYLGNLIMGQTIRKEGIASSYDKLGDLTVQVYDRGKMYKQNKLSTDQENKECNGAEFYVNMNEATSTIQWVNIGGMCWFDTPGIGSVTVENEELAQEYVKNSDLVIFACNSDAAGTRQEFSEIRKLHEMEKPILLLLTQSDEYEWDEDEDGEEISILVPKSEKDRKDQEDYMLETLREQHMEDVLKYADILTVSAFLATEAIKNDDEEMFEQSNIGKLLDKLTSITKNDAADIKRNTPKSRINEMIDSIVIDLRSLIEAVSRYCSAIDENRQTLSDRKDWMVEEIKSKVRLNIMAIVGQAKAEIEKSGESMVEEVLVDRINQAINDTVQQVCVEEAVSQNNSVPNIEIKLTGIGELKMRQDSIPYQYVHVQKIERDPEGLFEKFGSKVLKKTYYTTGTWEETKYSTFDIGVNDNEILQNIVLKLGTVFEDTVGAYIERLTQGYYEPVEMLQRETVSEIEQVISKLEGMRM